MSYPHFLVGRSTPNRNDSMWLIEQRILGALSGARSGTGVPAPTLGDNGDTYVNINNGDFYVRSGDTWSIVTGGVGAPGGSGAAGYGTPEGIVSASVGTTYVDLNPPYDVYFKISGAGNTGWVMKVE